MTLLNSVIQAFLYLVNEKKQLKQCLHFWNGGKYLG